jgi:hypothetical protein
LDTNPYAIIKNSHQATVGQLVGDGAVLTFLPNDSIPTLFGKRGTNDLPTPTIPPPTSFSLQNPMLVCVALRSDIPKSTHEFPIPDIAFVTYVCRFFHMKISHFSYLFLFYYSNNWTSWTPLGVQVNVTDDGYCFLATQDGKNNKIKIKRKEKKKKRKEKNSYSIILGRYFPILRVADFKDKRNTVIADKTLLAFIYIFGVVMLLLSFVCAYQIWVASKNVRTSRKLNLAFVLFFFMFLFVLGMFCLLLSCFQVLIFFVVRGLYLLILPSGRLEHNEGAKYFLSEAPQFFFYTVYSVIIFAWYALILKNKQQKTRLKKNFKQG